jgi:hypothetical protein
MRTHRKIESAILAMLATTAALLAIAPGASAAGPQWKLMTVTRTQAAEGESVRIQAELNNSGTTALDGATPGHPIVFSGELPPGLQLTQVEPFFFGGGCTETAHSFVCTDESSFVETHTEVGFLLVNLEATVEAGASGSLTAFLEVKGGDPSEPSDSVLNSIEASPAAPTFGIAAFDVQNDADAAGTPFTRAGGHPYDFPTSIDLHTLTRPGPLKGVGVPVEPPKDIVTSLPPGVIANPSAAPKCDQALLANASQAASRPLCPPESQVGTADLTFNFAGVAGAGFYRIPVFNVQAPPGSAARLGLSVFGVTVVLDGAVRNGRDYGVDVAGRNISEGIGLAGITVDAWGAPASPVHDAERACPGENAPSLGGNSCESEAEEVAFLRMPTSCEQEATGLLYTVRADSWFHPGDFVSRSIRSHNAPGYPLPAEPSIFPAGYSGPTEWGAPQGPTDCEDVPFEPSISVQPTTQAADSPTGLEVDLQMPQESLEEPGAIATSDLRDAAVTLPKGMTVNPSSATGLEACTPAQIGLTTPVGDQTPEFSEAAPTCPAGSKIGSVDIETPLLEEHVVGSLYLAQQSQNPFGSLISTYIVARANGILLKLAGSVEPKADGQLVASFAEQPQQPFSKLHLSFFGGPRAALRTPPACGTYSSQATLTPWSGNPPVELTSSFQITGCPNSGFDPKLSTGTQNPLAGSFSPFSLRLTREDGTQEISSLTATLPPGLLGKLKGVAYCPESALAAVKAHEGELATGAAQVAAPSCPASSQIGTVTVGAGAGVTPFYTGLGHLYLAGPYKGAPYSIAAIVPALAGPFDLGTVLVRNPLDLDHESTAIKVSSDPFPSILHGIPLDLRDIRVEVSRPEFTINPTSCDVMAVTSTITSTLGLSASPSDRFQLAGCDRLGFKPKLTLALKGAVHRRAHPVLIADLKGRPGDANIAKAQVKLPPAAFLDNAHIGTVCTRVQFAAGGGGGGQCPATSIYGRASATTPLLNYPVAGPVYLRSNPAHKLPDLVVALKGSYGEAIEVDLAGKTDSVNGALRNTFEAVPDAPVSSFHLELFGGKRGLIEMSSGFCAHPKAAVNLDAQNGRLYDTTPTVKAKCGGTGKKPKHRRHSR